MARLLGIVIVIFEDVQKSEERTIDPTTTLLHQILVILHGVSLGNRIGNISQVILLLRLTVNPQGKNAILSEVHVGLAVVLLLQFWIQNHLKIAVLEQVRLIFL